MSNLFDILSFQCEQSPAEKNTRNPDTGQPQRKGPEHGRRDTHRTYSNESNQPSRPNFSGSKNAKRTGSFNQESPKPGSIASTSPLKYDDKIPELDTLKTFTIPKKKKARRELLEQVSLQSREFQHEVLPVLVQSFKDRQVAQQFRFTQAWLVHNDDFLQQFQDRRKEFRSNGYSEKEVADSWGFYFVEHEGAMRRLCETGALVGNSRVTCIGNPDMGVQLCRHADMFWPEGLVQGLHGRLVIFKFMKGKVKSMVENPGSVPLDPTPNLDAHVSKTFNYDLHTTPSEQAYKSSQVYLYEYDEDFDVVKRPRQVCPYAAVTFVYTGPTRVVRPKISPRLVPSQRSPLTLHTGGSPMVATPPGGKPGHISPALSPGMASPSSAGHSPCAGGPPLRPPPAAAMGSLPSPMAPQPLRSPQTAPLRSPLGTPQPQRSPQGSAPSMLSPQNMAGMRAPFPPGPHVAPPSPQGMASGGPGLKSPLSDSSYSGIQRSPGATVVRSPSTNPPPGAAAAPGQPLMDCTLSQQEGPLADPPTAPASNGVGREMNDNGCIVWQGQMVSQGVYICNVELIAYGTSVKPARIGPQLDIVSRMPVTALKERFLSSVSCLDKYTEIQVDGRYYCYCQLQPDQKGTTKFKQIVAYLAKNESGAYVELDSGVEAVILPDCPLLQKIGLGPSSNHDVILHCIFVASSGRLDTLRDGPDGGGGSAEPELSSSLASSRTSQQPQRTNGAANAGGPRMHVLTNTPIAGPTQTQLAGEEPEVPLHPLTKTPLVIPGGYVRPIPRPAPGFSPMDPLRELFPNAHTGLADDLHNSKSSLGDILSLPAASDDLNLASPLSLDNPDSNGDKSDLLFKEPPSVTRTVKPCGDAAYDSGFRKFVPVESLLYKDTLVRAFQEQMTIQCNAQRRATGQLPAHLLPRTQPPPPRAPPIMSPAVSHEPPRYNPCSVAAQRAPPHSVYRPGLLGPKDLGPAPGLPGMPGHGFMSPVGGYPHPPPPHSLPPYPPSTYPCSSGPFTAGKLSSCMQPSQPYPIMSSAESFPPTDPMAAHMHPGMQGAKPSADPRLLRRQQTHPGALGSLPQPPGGLLVPPPGGLSLPPSPLESLDYLQPTYDNTYPSLQLQNPCPASLANNQNLPRSLSVGPTSVAGSTPAPGQCLGQTRPRPTEGLTADPSPGQPPRGLDPTVSPASTGPSYTPTPRRHLSRSTASASTTTSSSTAGTRDQLLQTLRQIQEAATALEKSQHEKSSDHNHTEGASSPSKAPERHNSCDDDSRTSPKAEVLSALGHEFYYSSSSDEVSDTDMNDDLVDHIVRAQPLKSISLKSTHLSPKEPRPKGPTTLDSSFSSVEVCVETPSTTPHSSTAFHTHAADESATRAKLTNLTHDDDGRPSPAKMDREHSPGGERKLPKARRTGPALDPSKRKPKIKCSVSDRKSPDSPHLDKMSQGSSDSSSAKNNIDKPEVIDVEMLPSNSPKPGDSECPADRGARPRGLPVPQPRTAETKVTPPTVRSKSVQKDSRTSITETIAELARVMNAIQQSISPVKKPEEVVIIPPVVIHPDDAPCVQTPEVDSSSTVLAPPEEVHRFEVSEDNVTSKEDQRIEAVLASAGQKCLPDASDGSDSLLTASECAPTASNSCEKLPVEIGSDKACVTSPDLTSVSSKVPVATLQHCHVSSSLEAETSSDIFVKMDSAQTNPQTDPAGPDHEQFLCTKSVLVETHDTKPDELCESDVKIKGFNETEQASLVAADDAGADGENDLEIHHRGQSEIVPALSSVPKLIPSVMVSTDQTLDDCIDKSPLVGVSGTAKLVPLEVLPPVILSDNVTSSNAKQGSLFGEPGSRDVAANGKVLFENVEVAVGDEEEDVQVSFTWDPSTLAGFDAEEFSDEDDLVELCVVKAIQNNDLEDEDSDPEESEVEQMWTDLWFFFLHVLPHMRGDGSIASNQREVLQALANMDKENRSKKTTYDEAPASPLGLAKREGCIPGLDLLGQSGPHNAPPTINSRCDDRKFHPYRRPAVQIPEPRLKIYEVTRDVYELTRNLTLGTFRRRNPTQSQYPNSRPLGPARFRGLVFRRDAEKSRRRKDEDETAATREEISDFATRVNQCRVFEKAIKSIAEDGDIQTRLEMEQKLYYSNPEMPVAITVAGLQSSGSGCMAATAGLL